MQNRYILVADDDIDDFELFSDRFNKKYPGVGWEFVNDGNEAFNFLKGRAENDLPVLLLVDYKMPVVNGAQLLELLVSNEKYLTIPKVVWSSSANAEYVTRCMTNGASRYFTKPSDISQLDHMIDWIVKLLPDALQEELRKKG